jgi:hypothetical protein
MISLLDLMTPEDREKAIERGKKRLQKRPGSTISPELYITAEFGYYFGWEGILAIKRGYIEKKGLDGQITQEPFTLEEVMALLEAAKKVWYTKIIDQSHGNFVANYSVNTKKPSESFNNGMKPFMDGGK